MERLDILAIGKTWQRDDPVSVPRPGWSQPALTASKASTAEEIFAFVGAGVGGG